MFRRTFAQTTLSLLLLIGTQAHAVTLVWNGGGGDDNWSTAANWGGTAPAAGDILQFSGSTRLTTNNNLAADTLIGGIEFTNNLNPTLSAFTLSGNRITLGGNITTVSTGSGFNALITDTISLDMVLNGTRTITVGGTGTTLHNLTINGVISDGGGGFGVTTAGIARLTLGGANTYTGVTTLGGTAVLVLNHMNALPGGTGATGGTSGLTFAGGILGLGATDFTRGLGTGADQVQWTGAGGFAAFGANRVVNLGGGSATVTWNSGGFVPTGSALLFGYGNGSDTQDATHTVDFQNPIDLNGAVRTITVNDGNGTTNALIDAVLSGGIINGSGTGSLTKNGGGTLSLTAASTYTGQTYANGGVLLLNHANAAPGGINTTGGTSNVRLGGNGIVGLGTGDFTRGLGTGVDQVQWTGGGGFAAYNADRVVNIGGAGATVTWATGSFVPNGSALYLGAISATHTVDFQNPIELGSAVRTLEINEAASVALDAIVSGAITGTGGLTKNGDGTLLLSATNSSYTGQTYLAVNVTRVTKLADFGQPSSIGAGTAGVPVTMGSAFRVGTLNYVGTGDSTDRTFAFGTATATHANGGTIQNNGSGALTFTATNFNDAIAGITVARLLTLGGANTDLNTISGVIQNTNGATGVLNVTKADAGTWVLSGANTYSGTTTVSGGTLHLNNAGAGGTSSAIGTGAFSIGSGTTIDNSSGGAITLSTANATTLAGSFTFGGTDDLSLANGTSLMTAGRTITLNGAGRTLTLGTLTTTGGNNTLTVNDGGGGTQLKLVGLVLSENNQARSMTIAGSANVEVIGAVSDGPGTGADNLSYTGGGTLKLSSNNNYTGTTTLNGATGSLILSGSSTTSSMILTAGTLHINHASAIGSGTFDINGGAINNTSGGSIAMATANLVTLDGNFSFGGGNDLSFAAGTASTAGGRTITLNGTSKTLTFGPLSFTNSNTTTVTDAGSGNKLVLGGLVLAENNQARTQTFTGSGLIDITGAITDGPGTGADNLTYTGSNVMRLMGAASYTGATTVNTPNGTLRTTASGSLGTASLIVVQGTMELNHVAQTAALVTFGSTTNTAQTAAATIMLSSGTTLTQTGNLTSNDNVNTQASFLTGGTVDINGTRTWTVDDSAGVDADLTVASIIQNTGVTGTFTKNGVGRLVLSGNNTFADIFAVADGVVRILHPNALGSTTGGTTVANSGDALEISGGITVAGESLLINGTGVSTTGALRSLAGVNAWTGTIDLGGDARIQVDAGSQLTVSAITAGGTSRDVTLAGEGDIIASGKIGSGGTTPVDQVIKDGTGTATLSNPANDFTNTLTINNGILKLGASQVIPDAENVTINKGTLELNGFAETIAVLTLGATTTSVAGNAASVIDTAAGGILRLTNNVTYNAGSAGFENAQGLISSLLDLNNATRTFTVNDNATLVDDVLISGIISNSGAGTAGLTKSGAGTLLLSGQNTYNGTTTINVGTLKLGANNALPDTAVTLDQRLGGVSTLDIAGRADAIGALTLNGNSSTVANSVGQVIDSSGGGILRLGGNVTHNIGATGFHNGTSFISANVDLNGTTRTFTINDSTNAANDTVVSGIISNSGATAGLIKGGAGVLVLSGANTYDGNTTFASTPGVLRASHNQAFGTMGSVSLINTDAVLELGDGITIDRPMDVSNTGNNKTLRLQDGASGGIYSGDITISETTAGNFDLSASAGGKLTVAGAISGTGASGISKEGAGTVALTNANTYSGPTAVNAGTLEVNNTSGSGTGTGSVTTASGTVLGGTGTIAPASGNSITVVGSLAPGTQSANQGVGTLTFVPVSGDVTLAATSQMDFQLRTNGAHGLTAVFNPDGTLSSVSGTSTDGGNDRLVFNGGSTTSKLDFTSLAAGNFNITFTSGYTPQAGDVFDLLDWSNLNGAGHSSAIAGLSLSQLDLPSLTSFDPLLAWDTGLWASQGVLGIYSGVPEPSRMMLLILGGGLLLRRRHR